MRDKGYDCKWRKAPLVGVICMDQCMADVTDVSDVCCGWKPSFTETDMDGSMTIAEAAELAETNKNDIIAALPPDRRDSTYVKNLQRRILRRFFHGNFLIKNSGL